MASEATELIALIRSVASPGRSVIIEHVIRVLKECCARLVVLNLGKRIAEGRTADVLADNTVASVFSFDYGMDYQLLTQLDWFHVGIGGYAYQKVMDDTVNGRVYSNGNRGRALAIGPRIRYDCKLGGIVFKWQKEFAIESRSARDRF